MDIISAFITKEIGLLIVGIVAVLYFAGMIPVGDKRLKQIVIWRRLLPLVPLVLGVAGAFLPSVVGTEGEPASWGAKILVGVFAGFVAAHGRKVIKRGVLDKFDSDGRKTVA